MRAGRDAATLCVSWRRMRQLTWAAVGAVAGAVFVLVLGYLSMRVSAAHDGVALHPVTNDIEIVVGPHVPALILAVTAIVGSVTISGLVISVVRLTPGSAAAANIAFAVVTFALVIAAYTAWEFGPAVRELGDVPYSGGVLGWLKYGGRDSLAATTALVAVATLALQPIFTRRPRQEMAHSAATRPRPHG